MEPSWGLDALESWEADGSSATVGEGHDRILGCGRDTPETYYHTAVTFVCWLVAKRPSNMLVYLRELLRQVRTLLH